MEFHKSKKHWKKVLTMALQYDIITKLSARTAAGKTSEHPQDGIKQKVFKKKWLTNARRCDIIIKLLKQLTSKESKNFEKLLDKLMIA